MPLNEFRLDLPARLGRDTVLVIANDHLRSDVVEAGRRQGFESIICRNGIELVQQLEQRASRIAYAVISSDQEWALGMRKYLSETYPDIHNLMLIS